MAQDPPGVSSRQQGLGVPEVRPVSGGGHRQGGYENIVDRYARKAIDCTHRRNLEEIEADNLGGIVDDDSGVDNPRHSILSIPSKLPNTSIMMVMFHFRLCSPYLGTSSPNANPPGETIQPNVHTTCLTV